MLSTLWHNLLGSGFIWQIKGMCFLWWGLSWRDIRLLVWIAFILQMKPLLCDLYGPAAFGLPLYIIQEGVPKLLIPWRPWVAYQEPCDTILNDLDFICPIKWSVFLHMRFCLARYPASSMNHLYSANETIACDLYEPASFIGLLLYITQGGIPNSIESFDSWRLYHD